MFETIWQAYYKLRFCFHGYIANSYHLRGRNFEMGVTLLLAIGRNLSGSGIIMESDFKWCFAQLKGTTATILP